jgi:hypothetical protein
MLLRVWRSEWKEKMVWWGRSEKEGRLKFACDRSICVTYKRSKRALFDKRDNLMSETGRSHRRQRVNGTQQELEHIFLIERK